MNILRQLIYPLAALLAVVTTGMAGAAYVTNRSWLFSVPGNARLTAADWPLGLPYAGAMMLFLLTHEFGHYLAARWHKVKATLPLCLPMYLPEFFFMNPGTMGAVIRLKDRPRSRNQFFDIGVAGPLAGFIVAVVLLTYGFTNLPPLEYLYQMNDYEQTFGHVPSEEELLQEYKQVVFLGNNLFFWGMEHLLADSARMPTHAELIHYPFLFAGFLALLFTGLNLLPIGQLDGGHVVYGLFGPARAALVSRLAVITLATAGGVGLIDFSMPLEALIMLPLEGLALVFIVSRVLGKGAPRMILVTLVLGIISFQQLLQVLLPGISGMPYWLLLAVMFTWIAKLDHPITQEERPLTPARRVAGWAALAVFVLTFTPVPLEIRRYQEPKGVLTHVRVPGASAAAPQRKGSSAAGAALSAAAAACPAQMQVPEKVRSF